MRTLTLQFDDDALPVLDQVLKHVEDSRLVRRAEAVRNVVEGATLREVSESFAIGYSTIQRWVKRFHQGGVTALIDHPRSGRPRTMTDELVSFLNHLAQQDPREYGVRNGRWSSATLTNVLRQRTGIHMGSECVRRALHRSRSERDKRCKDGLR